MTEYRAQEVLDFWFGADPLGAEELPRRLDLWFGGDEPPGERARRDAVITRRFAPHVEAAARGELDTWASSPRRLLALVIVLDQFPRQVYRGKARAFSLDEKAQQLCVSGLDTGADAALAPIERVFFYLPLQHAEVMALQDESITAYDRLAGEVPAAQRELFEDFLKFAISHRDVIERFGRFPHRNLMLGRRSTAAEIAYLRGEPPPMRA